MCVSSNKGKHRLTNQANWFLRCSPPLKTNKTQHLPLYAPPSPKECTQYPSSFTHLAEANHTWHFPYAQFQACSSRGHSEIQGPWTTYPFPAFWELNYKVLPWLSATVSHPCPSTNPSAFTSLINEWSPILAVIKKDTSLFPQLAWNTATVSSQQIQYSHFNSAHNPGQQNVLNSLSDQTQSWRTTRETQRTSYKRWDLLLLYIVLLSHSPHGALSSKKINNEKQKNQQGFTQPGSFPPAA